MNSTNHGKTLGIIFLILGGLRSFAWIMTAGWLGGDWLTAIYATLFLLTGWKLHNGQEGTKVLGIVSSILCLSAFPIGTIIGIYGLWYFLMKDEG